MVYGIMYLSIHTMRVKVTLIATLILTLMPEMPMNKGLWTICESMRVNCAKKLLWNWIKNAALDLRLRVLQQYNSTLDFFKNH